jgi:tetratricopeptide (TPR) repeat protein
LIIGSCLILGSVFLKWVEFPFSDNPSGLQLPLLHDSGIIPHITLFSFGALGVVVLIAGLASLRFFVLGLSLAAAVLITLCVLVPTHIAFEQPMMLRRLTDELQVTSLIKVFTKDYLPQNYGVAEQVPKQLVLYTAEGRFLAAYSFLRLGWTCFALGSLLIGVYAISRLPGARMTTGLALVCLPVGALAIVLTPPLIGQHYFTSGSIAKARGRDQEAIADYRTAMRWDAWHAQDIDLYATIGQLQKQAGIAYGSPERHVSRALDLQAASEYERAIFEFGQATEAGGALAMAARGESAKTRVTLGLALYHAGGIGGAVTSWQLALEDDPMQVYALPYLARGYYDLGRYEAALQTIDRLVKIIADHNSQLGDAYSLGGDCYTKLGRDADARHYYNLSLTADPIENYWALTGIIGE